MRSDICGTTSLELRNVTFSYGDGFYIRDIRLSVNGGEMVALLGPNGCGKTTLLKLLSGIYEPAQGSVLFCSTDLRHLSRRQIAQHIAVVPQRFDIPFAFRVWEVVLLGRTPFIHLLRGEKQEDHEKARLSMELTGITELEDRMFNELSGGERQKTMLALAMAQQPRVLLLDEPTAHLDISHQVEILGLVRKLNREQAVTVVAAMHDLNLAALYFDRLVLLDHGAVSADGTATMVLTEEAIKAVYGASVRVTQHPTSSVPHIIVLP
ncbi:MAG: ABC transporter ATP-binding protein [Chloroflexota bacterium]